MPSPLFSSQKRMLPLVLASSSMFRRELLARFQLPFETAAPEVDETALPGETPVTTALRLAHSKARAIAQHYPKALIIGPDQVAFCKNRRYGKPGTRENARIQLQSMRGKDVIFHTGLCVLNSQSGHSQVGGVETLVGFRDLSDQEIEAYLDKEDALNCAGSAKSEGLGITLLRYMRGDDPTALVGLPLIALAAMLRHEGLALP